MRDNSLIINIIAVIYYQYDSQEEDSRYVQLDAEVFDSEIRRVTFYLPFEKFNVKQVSKRVPWVYSHVKRKDIAFEFLILWEDFLERPDLDPDTERIILDKRPPDFDKIYVEFRDGSSKLLKPKQIRATPHRKWKRSDPKSGIIKL